MQIRPLQSLKSTSLDLSITHTVSRLPGHVVAAIDINTVANTVYAHNHPATKLLTRNIQKVDAAFVRRQRANTILMSPPCQPFTRTGKQQDVDDTRTDALRHLCGLLPQLDTVDAVLMENVRGFETSRARDMYVSALRAAGFHLQEFILSPGQLQVPNTRHRYYCLARKWAPFACSPADGTLLETFPERRSIASAPPYGRSVAHHLDAEGTDHTALLLPDDLLRRRARVLDIAGADAERTMCFTKAYTHYTEGTGSVFCPESAARVAEVFALAAEKQAVLDDGGGGAEEREREALEALRSLRMRYFSPDEVARLMSFRLARGRVATVGDDDDDADADAEGECFSFPPVTTNRQRYAKNQFPKSCRDKIMLFPKIHFRYRLLGNSINVFVVSELIQMLFEPEINPDQ